MEPWKEAKMSRAMWDTILLWSCYDYYRSIEEIAKELGISVNVVSERIKRFKKKNPKAYEKIKEDRNSIRKTTTRLDIALNDPFYYGVKIGALEPHIKEKF